MKVISSHGLKPLSLLALALILASCAVGPDYQAPKPSVPGSYNSLDSQEASKPQSAAINSRWWRTFNDPQLDSLIARAIEGNLTLQQAVLRIAGAREQLAQAQGAVPQPERFGQSNPPAARAGRFAESQWGYRPARQ